MAYKSDILLGRITRVSGYEGTVSVKLERLFSEKIPELGSVFLEIEGRPVPFFISDLDYSGADILRLTFEGYNTAEKVAGFVGCRVFLTSPPEGGKADEETGDLTGYTVRNQDKMVVGIVKAVIRNPGQWLLNVEAGAGKIVLVPLHRDLILSIDERKKVLVMDLPEGLTEIN